MQVFNEILSSALKEVIIPLDSIDVIIPIPLHRSKLKKRGFNQSLLIADFISKLTLLPLSESSLIKKKSTPSQISLSKPERIKNLEGSFEIVSFQKIQGKSVLLVDDIMTTGATLDTCASELMKAGAKEIYGFTLARTPLLLAFLIHKMYAYYRKQDYAEPCRNKGV